MSVTTLSNEEQRTIARILKVNHAGETGAIKIYQAQILVCRLFHQAMVDFLQEMLAHEIEHCRLFAEAMPARNARPCRAMWLWGLGGWLLGIATALMGKNMIWICTEAIEAAVHRHLEDQLAFLQGRDNVLCRQILVIQQEELAHLKQARDNIVRVDQRRFWPMQ